MTERSAAIVAEFDTDDSPLMRTLSLNGQRSEHYVNVISRLNHPAWVPESKISPGDAE